MIRTFLIRCNIYDTGDDSTIYIKQQTKLYLVVSLLFIYFCIILYNTFPSFLFFTILQLVLCR